MIEIYGRYGRVGSFEESDPTLPSVFTRLIDELCDEQFPAPDIEHESIFATNDAGWSILAKVSGLVSWANVNDPHSKLYVRDVPRERLHKLFMMLASDEIDAVQRAGWVPREQLPRFRRNFYLYLNRPLKTDLHKAVQLNDFSWARDLIANRANLNAVDEFGATPLHCAALANHLEMCRLLIAAGADLTCVDVDSQTPIDYAFESPEIQALLRAHQSGK